jgi:hypothetical protein
VQLYPVRNTHKAQLTAARLSEICRGCFDSAVVDGPAVTASWGALSRLRVWPEKKGLAVEVTMDPKVDVTVAGETVRRYNRFLEEATGFSSKERAKRLRKSASGPSDGA